METIAKDAYCCAQQGKRKTLQRRDLDNAIEAVDEFAFLEGEFTVCTNHFPAGDVSSNLTGTDACFSFVHGNSSPCFLFLGEKKHFPFLGIRVSTGKLLA